MSSDTFLSFPLAKVSIAKTQGSAGSSDFRHYFGDVTVNFSSYRVPANDTSSVPCMMKFCHGALVLVYAMQHLEVLLKTNNLQEEVNLIAKVQKSIHMVEGYRQAQMSYDVGKLPTIAIYKRETFSILFRYRCDYDIFNQRIAMTFISPQDFDRALEHLQRIKCPLTSALQGSNASTTSHAPSEEEAIQPSKKESVVQHENNQVSTHGIPPPRQMPVSRPSSSRASGPTTSDLPPPTKSTLVRESQDLSAARLVYPAVQSREEAVPMEHEMTSRPKRPAASEDESLQVPERPSTAPASHGSKRAVRQSTPYPRNEDSVVNPADTLPDLASSSRVSMTELLEGNKENLGHYAEQPYDIRREALEQLVLDQLRDPSFRFLCEDVEGCWIRFGLDLH